MNRLLIVGFLIISTAPLLAQAQKKPDAAKLKADAQKVVGIISGDKAKAEAYCQMNNVGEQKNQARKAKDEKKAEELAQKQTELEENLGPEYLGLVESLGKTKLPRKDGLEIVSMFDKLDESVRINSYRSIADENTRGASAASAVEETRQSRAGSRLCRALPLASDCQAFDHCSQKILSSRAGALRYLPRSAAPQ